MVDVVGAAWPALGVTLVIALGWRHRAAPAAGALAGVLLLLVTGAVPAHALVEAARTLARPMAIIVSILVLTACARLLRLFDRLALVVEPRTRGPVRHAFTLVFVLSAVAAALLTNDAAVLLLTPTVVTLLKCVYPKRHPRFIPPFAFAVFVAAGVAPFVTGNPMNVVIADRAGLSWNTYAWHMVPVAVVGWLVSYALLRRLFRAELADEGPALGDKPEKVTLVPAARAVMAIVVLALLAYPVIATLGGPLWCVAVAAAVVAALFAFRGGVRPRALAGEIGWEILPFLFGVNVLAQGLARAGAVEMLAHVYRTTPAPIPTVGVVSAVGSALIDNHPMGLLNLMAVKASGGSDVHVLAGLVGGDLGPRFLPMGSLAGLLWLDALRRQGVDIRLGQFVKVGLAVTIPSLAASLAMLWLLN